MRVAVASLAVLGLAGSASADYADLPETTIDPADDTAEIIGGTLAPAGKWPDTVAVLSAQGSCSGTLISPNVVLTAGHCIGGMTNVIASSIDYNAAGGARSTIKAQVAYPASQTSYDLGLVFLTTPITTVTPRKLGTSCTFTTPDFVATKPSVQLVGFGATDVNAQGNNTRLYEVAVPVTDGACSNSPGLGCRANIAPNGEFAAGGANKDSCNGDSGGPVYLNTARGYIVIGAVSRAFDNATQACGQGGIYVSTRNDIVQKWIKDTITANGGTAASLDTCDNSQPPSNPMTPDPNNPNPTNPTNPTNPDGTDESNDVTGGCNSGGVNGSGLLLLGLGLAFARRRRR